MFLSLKCRSVFSREFRLTRIPHTQTQSGVGRGGGYPPGTVAPPEGRWSAAEPLPKRCQLSNSSED